MAEFGMEMGARLASLRKEKGLTQEQMANELGITFQAVSKWENGLSCPDIALLPRIADFFRIPIDRLFGRAAQAAEPKEASPTLATVPWEDDGELRAVLFIGQSLVKNKLFSRGASEKRTIEFEYTGAALNVRSDFSIICDDVEGSVNAGTNVTCDSVGGSVSAGGSVTCDSVGDAVRAGTSVACDDVGGSVSAGGNVDCGDIAGNVNAGGCIDCGDVSGRVTAGGRITIEQSNGN